MFEGQGPLNPLTLLHLLMQGLSPGAVNGRSVPTASGVPAASVAAGQQGTPAMAPVDVMSPPEPPAAPRGVPVATPGSAVAMPQSGNGDLPPSAQDLLTRLRGPAQPDVSDARQAATPAASLADLGNNPLARFGFAMAASRNPSLFGQIGEAGLAMQQGNRENRQDRNREAEVEVMRDYRRSQADLARAQLEWQRDPNNPRTIALLAEARYRDAAAQHQARMGSGGGEGGGGGPFVQIQNPETGEIGFFQPRSGNLVRAPEGFGRPGDNAREESARQRDMLAFGTLNRNNPMYLADGNALMRDAQAYADAQAARRRSAAPRSPAAGGTTTAPTAGAPDRVIDLTPRTR